MRAVVHQTREDGRWCSARTDNDLAIVFSVTDAGVLVLGDELEVDLANVLDTQEPCRARDGRRIAIRLNRFDVHDLRVPSQGHGVSRDDVSPERLLSR
jgi:hypothetical protein